MTELIQPSLSPLAVLPDNSGDSADLHRPLPPWLLLRAQLAVSAHLDRARDACYLGHLIWLRSCDLCGGV